jgi:eukaryotic-like serine/threonine-protein kinase
MTAAQLAGREQPWPFEPGEELVDGLRAWAMLGAGPRCQTWLAWDTGRWSPVAVKLPHPDEVGGRRAETALERERDVAVRLAHPALRRLLDAHLDRHPPYLVFEYVEGPTLDAVLDEEGRLHPADVAQVGLHLAAALRYLHGNGFVHLDVKPGNAVLRDGRVVLIDLGIARPCGQGPDPGRSLAGSPPWMAPEQIRNLPAAPAMDLFALGTVLYELATGEPAFQPSDRGPSERRYPQLHARPAPARTVVPTLPARLGQVIDALLEPDPGDRPGSAEEVLGALAALPCCTHDLPWPGWATRLLDRPG